MDVSATFKIGNSTTQTSQTEKMALSTNSDDDDSLYHSARDNTESNYKSFDGSDNNNEEICQSTFYYSTPLKNASQFIQNTSVTICNVSTGVEQLSATDGKHSDNINNTNHLLSTTDINLRFIESESFTLSDEVDPKSKLANKTIFKTDNPDLSIIEINENTLTNDDAKNSIVIFDSSSNQISPRQIISENENHQKRCDSKALAHAGKQALNVSDKKIETTESSASQSLEKASITDIKDIKLPKTKREIIIYDTLEEFEKNLPSTVNVLTTPFGSKVYLIGTAHFSEESQDDVSFVIRNVRPDAVVVELCQFRIPMLKLDEKTLLEEVKNISLAKIRNILQTNGYITGLFFILLLQVSAQSTKGLGTVPGGEFRRAFEEVHCLPGCSLHLGDRPLRITLHRTLHSLNIWQTIKLIWTLTSYESVSMEEIEECKQQNLLGSIMQKMAEDFPAFTNVFLKERDIYLCHSLQLASLPRFATDGSNVIRPVRVVGVVGIAHAEGIINMWGRVHPQQIPALLDIPPPTFSTRLCIKAFKYTVGGLILYGCMRLYKRFF